MGLHQSVESAQCLLLSAMRAYTGARQTRGKSRDRAVKPARSCVFRQDGLMVLTASSNQGRDRGRSNTLSHVAKKIHKPGGSVGFFRRQADVSGKREGNDPKGRGDVLPHT